ncbi:MAG: addiction module toxin, HicA family [Acidipila sp.]|nr:addiction module toxin, HicA family [Acidipila sp.]
MTRLPRISGQDCLSVLQNLGFFLRRQSGSHMIVRRDTPHCQVVIPNHKELDPGTLRAIIRQTGLSVDDFIRLL